MQFRVTTSARILLVTIFTLLAVSGCKQRSTIKESEKVADNEGCFAAADHLADALKENAEWDNVREALTARLAQCGESHTGADVLDKAQSYAEDDISFAGDKLGELIKLVTRVAPIGSEVTPKVGQDYLVCVATLPGAEGVALSGVSLTLNENATDRCGWKTQLGPETIMDRLNGETERELTYALDIIYNDKTVSLEEDVHTKAPVATADLNLDDLQMHSSRQYELTFTAPVSTEVRVVSESGSVSSDRGTYGSLTIEPTQSSMEYAIMVSADGYRDDSRSARLEPAYDEIRLGSKTVLQTAEDFCLDHRSECDLEFRRLKSNPSGYKGERVHFRGRINQVVVDRGLTLMRVGVASYGMDNIAVLYESSTPEFYEDEYIHVYGWVAGSYDYESQAGWDMSIPQVSPFLLTDSSFDDYESPFEP